MSGVARSATSSASSGVVATEAASALRHVGEHVGRGAVSLLGVLGECLLEEADERVGDRRVEVAGFDGGALDELRRSFAVAVDRRVTGRHLEEGYGGGVPLGRRVPVLARASPQERVKVGRRAGADGGGACLGEREVEEDEVLGAVTLLLAHAEVGRLDVTVVDARLRPATRVPRAGRCPSGRGGRVRAAGGRGARRRASPPRRTQEGVPCGLRPARARSQRSGRCEVACCALSAASTSASRVESLRRVVVDRDLEDPNFVVGLAIAHQEPDGRRPGAESPHQLEPVPSSVPGGASSGSIAVSPAGRAQLALDAAQLLQERVDVAESLANDRVGRSKHEAAQRVRDLREGPRPGRARARAPAAASARRRWSPGRGPSTRR